MHLNILEVMKTVFLFVFLTVFATRIYAQLPDGPGQAETEKLCKQCHEVARSVSLRQDRAGWNNTMTKMVAFGMKGDLGIVSLDA